MRVYSESILIPRFGMYDETKIEYPRQRNLRLNFHFVLFATWLSAKVSGQSKFVLLIINCFV